MVPRPENTKDLADSVTLPCGLVFPNRLIKGAMNESLGGTENWPDERIHTAYKQWGAGNWGGLITGNILIDRNHLGGPTDIALRTQSHFEANIEPWKKYAAVAQEHGTPTIVQICHAGRQSPIGAGQRGIMEKTLAPSAIPLSIGDGWIAQGARSFMFGTPKEMTVEEIEDVVERFVVAAKCVHSAGFKGVEVHGAHGYLLSSFLTPSSNKRTDAYGGTAEKRAKIVLDIISRIRAELPSTFCVGIKLNSVDAQSSDLEDTIRQVELLSTSGIDFLEISGGSYEDPKMVGAAHSSVSARTAAREAYFLDFAETIRRRFPDLILLVTGGFRTRKGMQSALDHDACDLIGIGRPACVDPALPKKLLDKKLPDEEAQLVLRNVPSNFISRWSPVKVMGAGLEMSHYYRQIAAMGSGLPTQAP